MVDGRIVIQLSCLILPGYSSSVCWISTWYVLNEIFFADPIRRGKERKSGIYTNNSSSNIVQEFQIQQGH